MRRGLLLLPIPLVVAVAALALARRGGPAEDVASPAGPPVADAAAVPVNAPATTTTTTEPPAPPPPAAAPNADAPRFPTTVAVSKVRDIAVYDAPEGRQVTSLHSPAPYSNMPQVFTVEPTPGPPGWYHVNLRTRPNGSQGWIRAADVGTSFHTWSIDINLGARWATVYDGDQVFEATAVVIGTGSSPTPTGDFFITEGVKTGQPRGAYGPFIYGLSAHSDVYTEFGGGDGQVGLHGTNQPGLLGSAASHGCVRFPNAVIQHLADTLPMGVPVHIHE